MIISRIMYHVSKFYCLYFLMELSSRFLITVRNDPPRQIGKLCKKMNISAHLDDLIAYTKEANITSM
jgi:hypothetical protein